jgi:hypothetical protein
MKKYLFLAGIAAFSCCKPKTAMVGNDLKNGCKASAGYLWSNLKKTCVRPFEIGTKLNPTDENSTSAAYLVFEGNSVEIFAAELPEPLVLTENSEKIWSKNGWKLSQENAHFSLEKDGKLIYKI